MVAVPSPRRLHPAAQSDWGETVSRCQITQLGATPYNWLMGNGLMGSFLNHSISPTLRPGLVLLSSYELLTPSKTRVNQHPPNTDRI
ncbi:hypothetical protein DPEC_G00004230 [Dallia pectoralis]|uniref:Uncharacterized protein n=1 Tax=Dallia pectoralis TaxID=75939 RepID=A0ACC2HKA3_DALPE|nr:hypothetical protein DPEC_G00004230 [Dallia pectoralis]